MATIRVILTTLDGTPLGSFEVSESQEHGRLTADDELGIMEGIQQGLALASLETDGRIRRIEETD